MGKRILIADDGEEVRQVVRAIFEARTSHRALHFYTMYNELLGLSLASAVGATAVVSKAEGMSKLLECVQNLLEPKAPPTAPETTTSTIPVSKPPAATK